MAREPAFDLRISRDGDDSIAYLRLPTHPGTLCKMSKSVRLIELLGPYKGPDVVLDFDEGGVLVGIEILPYP